MKTCFDIALNCLILRSELYYTLSLDCIVLMEKLEFRSEIHWRGFDYISDTISQIQRSNLIPTGTVQFYTEGYMNVWMCECVWKDTSTTQDPSSHQWKLSVQWCSTVKYSKEMRSVKVSAEFHAKWRSVWCAKCAECIACTLYKVHTVQGAQCNDSLSSQERDNQRDCRNYSLPPDRIDW